MARVTIAAIPAVRGYCAQLATYSTEGQRALEEMNHEIAKINERHDQVRGLRRIRRDEDEQELADVRMRIRQCGEGQEAEMAALQAQADELQRQLQHHDDMAHELEVGFRQFSDSEGDYRSASASAIGVMLDGEHEGAQLTAALNDVDSYKR
jgi:chromosome segregation ATPase